MELDQANIAIRERNFGEILGLSLQLFRLHFVQIMLAGSVGMIAAFLLNYFLLSSLISPLEYEHNPQLYWFLMIYLVGLEVPIVTAPITLYLGQITFAKQVSWAGIWRSFWSSFAQLFLLQGVARAFLLWIFLYPYWRAPYLTELILLERNKLFGGRGQLTTLKRSSNLHTNNGGELVNRPLFSRFAGDLLWAMIAYGSWWLLQLFFSIKLDWPQIHLFLLPITLWIIVAYFAVVRFLSYLDLRIRREGWEIELLMRAEATRMRGQIAVN